MSTTIKNMDRNSVLSVIRVRSNECVDLHRIINKEIKDFMEKCSVLGGSGLQQLGYKEREGLIYQKFQLVQSSLSNTSENFNNFNSTFIEVKAGELFQEHFIYSIESLIKLEELLQKLKNKVSNYYSASTNIRAASDDDKKYNKVLLDEVLSDLDDINSLMVSIFEGIINVTQVISSEINNRIMRMKNNENLSFENRFREQTDVIIKGFEHEVRSLTESFKNQIDSLKIDNDSVSKTYELLKKNTDNSLKNLADLNERTQNLELEYSHIINTESDYIKREIQLAKDGIEGEVNKIIEKIKNQSNAIKLVYADHIKMAENAALYELTDHYKVKAEEERGEYKDYRKFTSWAIWGAIISTLSILCYTIWEQYHPIGDKVVDISFLLLLSRLSISLMFFVLALYLSKQAAKHYECYQENHRTYLQLSALEPFMSRMTDDEKKEIRKGLIPSYFNQANDGKYASQGDEVDFSTNMTSIINNLIDKSFANKEANNSTNTENPRG